jgi:tRNA G10  N-methylase Trm11
VATNPIVLDCFCGSGTTLVAVETLGHRWIGIDQYRQAIEVAQKRLGCDNIMVPLPVGKETATTICHNYSADSL